MEVAAMLMNETVDKLIAMRLTAMADSLRLQMDDPSMNGVGFEDRFSMIVDSEYTRRKDNRLKRLIRNADFEQPDACISGIDYHSGRVLNRSLISRLATCVKVNDFFHSWSKLLFFGWVMTVFYFRVMKSFWVTVRNFFSNTSRNFFLSFPGSVPLVNASAVPPVGV